MAEKKKTFFGSKELNDAKKKRRAALKEAAGYSKVKTKAKKPTQTAKAKPRTKAKTRRA